MYSLILCFKCALTKHRRLCATDVNECTSTPCLDGGTCLDGDNEFSCLCVQGFDGILCQTSTAASDMINACAVLLFKVLKRSFERYFTVYSSSFHSFLQKMLCVQTLTSARRRHAKMGRRAWMRSTNTHVSALVDSSVPTVKQVVVATGSSACTIWSP